MLYAALEHVFCGPGFIIFFTDYNYKLEIQYNFVVCFFWKYLSSLNH